MFVFSNAHLFWRLVRSYLNSIKLACKTLLSLNFWAWPWKLSIWKNKHNFESKTGQIGHEFKKDHNQYKIFYIRKKYIFFVRLNQFILLTTYVLKLNSLLGNFPMVWKWYPQILFLNLNLTVLRIYLQRSYDSLTPCNCFTALWGRKGSSGSSIVLWKK